MDDSLADRIAAVKEFLCDDPSDEVARRALADLLSDAGRHAEASVQQQLAHLYPIAAPTDTVLIAILLRNITGSDSPDARARRPVQGLWFGVDKELRLHAVCVNKNHLRRHRYLTLGLAIDLDVRTVHFLAGRMPGLSKIRWSEVPWTRELSASWQATGAS